ncbi:MAG: hypothetical protein ABI317_02235 [Gaiellales bacterium]
MTRLRALSIEDVESTSPAARAAELRRSCGHVHGNAAWLSRGYRFVALSGAELPSFLVRRRELGDGSVVAVTLLAGLDPATGAPVLEGVKTSTDAAAALRKGPAGIWLVHLTIGNRTVTLAELGSALLGTPGLEELALADEVGALGLLPGQGCPLCGPHPA